MYFAQASRSPDPDMKVISSALAHSVIRSRAGSSNSPSRGDSAIRPSASWSRTRLRRSATRRRVDRRRQQRKPPRCVLQRRARTSLHPRVRPGQRVLRCFLRMRSHPSGFFRILVYSSQSVMMIDVPSRRSTGPTRGSRRRTGSSRPPRPGAGCTVRSAQRRRSGGAWRRARARRHAARSR
jgi:hypothetical protein